MTTPPFQADDFEWLEALSRAVSSFHGGAPIATAFQEEREDRRVVLSTGRPPESTVSFTTGVSIRRPGPPPEEIWAAGISPEAVSPLLDGRTPRPERREPIPKAEDRSGPARIVRAARSLFEAATARASGDGRTGTVAVVGSAFRQRVRVAAAGGTPRADTREGGWLRLEVEGSDRGRTSGAVVEVVLRGAADPPWDDLARDAFARMESRFEAVPADPRVTDVVFAPGIGGILLHELVGHSLEGDLPRDGGSWLAGDGARVAPAEVTVIDDPRRGRVPWRYDDEGVEARAVPLLREGRVAGALLDRASARRRSLEPTGHGRRSGFRDPVLPRMGATFLTAGSVSPADTIAEVRRGLYVRRMSGATCEPARGRAIFRVTEAEAIEQGRRSHPVQPFLLEVEGPRSLPTIDAIASDLSFDACIGTCQRLGQPLSTSVGAPTFRLRLIRVLSTQELQG